MDNILVYTAIAFLVGIMIGFTIRAFLKNKKATNITKTKSGLDISKLVSLLGNETNIIEVSSNGSKLSVVVKETKYVDVDLIKEMGASGIVQNNNKFIIIFGKMSSVIENELKSFLNM